ncbi:MAG: aspartate aminotransferase family protein [Promethearchaeota archaeon]
MECIFKLVPMAAGKQRLITFQGSYHGSNRGAASLSGHQALAKFVGTPGITKIPYANCYRCPFKQEYPGCGMTCIEYIENNILQTISPPEFTAAIIAEPMQSDGGDILPPPEFLPCLQRICKENGMYFVVDEVKVGVGRTGKWWACEHFGVTPDIIAIGKPIASGMPLSAVVARAEILDTTVAGHLFTSSGHPVCCAAGLATLDAIKEGNLLSNAEKVGNLMFKRLNEIKESHEIIGDVRGGKGLFLGVELVKDRKTKEPAATETAKVVYSAWEMGLITAIVGIFENVIEITPPLILTEEQAEQGLNIFEEAVKRVERGEVPDEKIEAFAGW